MSSDDVQILGLTLFGTIAAVVVVRLTFRHSPTARDALVSPAVFAACGALLAISAGMLWLADREGRVTIEKGTMLLVGGVSLGALFGAGARSVYSRMNRGKTVVFLLVMVLLGGSIGAPIGWVAGDIGSRMNGEFDREQLSASRMLWGLAIGAGVGFILGLSDVVFQRRGAT